MDTVYILAIVVCGMSAISTAVFAWQIFGLVRTMNVFLISIQEVRSIERDILRISMQVHDTAVRMAAACFDVREGPKN